MVIIMKTKTLAGILTSIMLVSSLAGCGGGGNEQTAEQESKGGFDSSSEITVVSREDGSGTRGAFIELMGIEEKGADGTKLDKTTKEAVIANKTDVMLTNVAGDEYSIGYVSIGSLSDKVKALDIDGIKASSDNVKNGTYKVSRPFNIAVRNDVSELAEDFIDYILSSDGQNIVSGGYIAINDNAQPYSGTKPSGKIVVAGSSSVTPIMEKLREAYLAINTNAEIEIQMSDSTSGMTGAIDGTCDIGMASRELKDSESETLTAVPIALDGIAVIVNPQNPVDDIKTEDVKEIFTGNKTTWDEVGK